MNWLDKIPTLTEVVTFTACRLSSHDWTNWIKVSNNLIKRECRCCGKVEEYKL